MNSDFAVLGMIGPLASRLDDLAWHWGHETTDNCYEIPLAVDLDSGDGVAVFFVRKRDAFDLAWR